ncbi:MAG: hypothetical protein ACJAT2_000707 [Bacteriovoracaceae bacterium]|jgi:hypothetical protein
MPDFPIDYIHLASIICLKNRQLKGFKQLISITRHIAQSVNNDINPA